jgi:hypothetical protein
MYVDGTIVILTITPKSISFMLLLPTPPRVIDEEYLVAKVNNWALGEKREAIGHFMLDENSIPKFFPISYVLFAPIY